MKMPKTMLVLTANIKSGTMHIPDSLFEKKVTGVSEMLNEV